MPVELSPLKRLAALTLSILLALCGATELAITVASPIP